MKKKVILAVCFLVFSLAGLVMILISMEEKRDLSGRATVGEQIIVPEELRKEYRGEVWRGMGRSLYYNANLWERDGDSFWNRVDNLVIKIVGADNDLDSLVGKDYKLLSRDKVVSEGDWTLQKFRYKFLNRNRQGEYWGKDGVGLLVLGNETINRTTVTSFMGGFSQGEQVQGAINYDVEEKVVEISKPSVVKVATKMCSQVNIVDGYSTLNGRSYGFCVNGSGSGFFVSGDGHIATNGHVIKFASHKDKIAVAVLSGGLDDLVSDLVKMHLSLMGVDVNSPRAVSFIASMLMDRGEMLRYVSAFIADYEDGYLSMDEEEYEYAIGLGKTPVDVDEDGNFNESGDIREAQLIGYDYEEMSDDGSFKSSDVALLKIDGDGYPAPPLGEADDLSQGSKIQVIGFPGIVSGGKNSFLNESMEVTVTGGVVSSIKTAKGDGKKLIQTDASITHGNSGGPAFDSQGNVIGMATYAIILGSSGGNYNFLRDVADIKALASQLGIEIESSDTYKKWKEGLNNYWRSYYRYAKSDFVDVKESYGDHLLADKYLEKVDGLVGSKSDLTPRFNKTQRDVIRLVCGVLMVGSVVVGAGVGVFSKKHESVLLG